MCMWKTRWYTKNLWISERDKVTSGANEKRKKKGMLTKTLFPRLSRMCSDRQKSRPPTGHGVSIAHSLHICKNRNSSIRHARSPYKNQSPYIANIDHIFFSIREKAEEKAKGTGALLSWHYITQMQTINKKDNIIENVWNRIFIGFEYVQLLLIFILIEKNYSIYKKLY